MSFVEEMEIGIGVEIEKTVNTFLDDLEGHIKRMLAAGMSEEQIKLNILNDLKNKGRVFSPLANGLKNTVTTSVNNSSNYGSNEVFMEAGIKEYRWITVSSRPCPDCSERHGQIRTMDEWRDMGLPGSGFSVCRRNCKCRLVPEAYEGENLDTPIVREPKKKKFHFSYSQVASQLVKSARVQEPNITPHIRGLAGKSGAKLAGLDFRYKSTVSLARKIQKAALHEGITVEAAGSNMYDLVRYTMLFDPAAYTNGVKKIMDELDRLGYNVVKFKNYWSKVNYKGINVQLIHYSGQKMELQFHTYASIRVKENLSHPIYKKIRRVGIAPEEAERLNNELLRIWADVKAPNGSLNLTY